jgi:hypothetical protein
MEDDQQRRQTQRQPEAGPAGSGQGRLGRGRTTGKGGEHEDDPH